MNIAARTALSPIIWGTTYSVTTLMMPANSPIWTAEFRALPIGILMLLLIRKLPSGDWWWRSFILGAFNIGLFFILLLIATYRLPGGMTAVLMASLPIQSIFYLWVLKGITPTSRQLIGAIGGLIGVGMLILGALDLDVIGLLAAIGATIMMFLGTWYAKEWGRPPEGLYAYSSWILTFGGLIILPVAFFLEGMPPALDLNAWFGIFWLGGIGAGFAYSNWFNGLAHLSIVQLAFFGLLSPLTAVLCGKFLTGDVFTPYQWAGLIIVPICIFYAQHTNK